MSSSIQLCFQMEVNNPFFPVFPFRLCVLILQGRGKKVAQFITDPLTFLPAVCCHNLCFCGCISFFSWLQEKRKESADLIPGVSSLHREWLQHVTRENIYLGTVTHLNTAHAVTARGWSGRVELSGKHFGRDRFVPLPDRNLGKIH